jgi:accessory gene regulator B
MFDIEKLSENIAVRISQELKFDNNKKEVIAYGAFALIQTIISIIVVFVGGLILGVTYEAILISFIASFLRKYSGGAHASSPLRCVIIGTFVCLSGGLLINPIIGVKIGFFMMVTVNVIIFIVATFIVCKLSPVDSIAKPIKSPTKKSKMKKQSLVVLGIYILLAVTNMVFYYKNLNDLFIINCWCIYFGVIWQVFTLTMTGHLVIKKIDYKLKNILSLVRRETNGEI